MTGNEYSADVTPGRYALSTGISQVGFAVRHLGISTVRGTFDEYGGTVEIGAAPSECKLAVWVATKSVNTGNPMRDRHLRGPDFLDVEAHPRMSYVSADVRPAEGGGYEIDGWLEIHQERVALRLSARLTGVAAFPRGAAGHDPCDRYGFTASGRLSRAECGVGFGAPIVSDEVQLILDGQLVSAAADRLDTISMARFDKARRILYGEIPASAAELRAARQLLEAAIGSVGGLD